MARYYLSSIGYSLSVMILVVFLGYEASTVGSSLWLARWADDPTAVEPAVRNLYLGESQPSPRVQACTGSSGSSSPPACSPAS